MFAMQVPKYLSRYYIVIVINLYVIPYHINIKYNTN